MQNRLQELLMQYKNRTGSDYQAYRYPNPKVTPQNLLKLVASIKIVAAEARQIEIMNEIRKGEKSGDAFIVSDEKFPLTNEFENLKNEVTLWCQHV